MARRRRSHRSPDRPRTVLRAVSMAIIDAAAACSTAALLWISGGSTVFTGPVSMQIVAFLVCSGLLAARMLLAGSRRQRTASWSRVVGPAIVLLSHVIMLGLLVAAWLRTDEYFLGWVACFASGLLTTGSIVQAIGAIRARRAMPLAMLSIGGGVVGAAGLLVTAPIHLWNSGIIDTLLFTTCSAVLLASLVASWTTSLMPRTPPSVGTPVEAAHPTR